MYFTIVALAAILMMSINLDANMNSKMNAYATIMSEIPNIDDFGQSAECVIVVVGCDGTGSVGSSGDTIIGSFNGNEDNNTNNGEDTPLPPLENCTDCLVEFTTTEQLDDLLVVLGLNTDTSFVELCAALEALGTVETLVTVLDEAGLSVEAIVDLLTCFGIEITLDEVIAIIGL